MLHVGVDLHKRVSQIAVLTTEGEISQHRLLNDMATVERFFGTLPKARVAIEATGTWWWLVDLLQRTGHEPVLSNPKQTKAIATAKLKNDRVDAQRLALLLRGDLLPQVWIPPAALREARELLRYRLSVVGVRTIIRNRLTALLARRNLQPEQAQRWTTITGLRELQALPLPETANEIRHHCLAALRLLDEQLRTLDRQLMARWGHDPRVQRLSTIPGVGVLIAIILVLEVGDIARFPSAKHLSSYVGLTPRVRASANRVRTGHISKEGNAVLRWALVVAATQAARRPGPLRAWYRGLQQRRGRQIARVALARRLAEISYHVWRDELSYFEVLRQGGVRG
jgi:transposase